ncbi:MAG: hypothetical protein ACFE9L_15010 [Candidatus Hodarchaeota archaeon]
MSRTLYDSTKMLFFLTLHHPTDIDLMKKFLEISLELLSEKKGNYLNNEDYRGRINANQPSIGEHLTLFSYLGIFNKIQREEEDYKITYMPTSVFESFFKKDKRNLIRNWKNLLIDRFMRLKITNNSIFREDFFELKNIRLRPYLLSLYILKELNLGLKRKVTTLTGSDYDYTLNKRISEGLVCAILFSLKTENFEEINSQIKLISEEIKDRDRFTLSDALEILYPHVEKEKDAIGVSAVKHELTRIQSVITGVLRRLDLISKNGYLDITKKGLGFLEEHLSVHPLWWNDIGGIFNSALLLLLQNRKQIKLETLFKIAIESHLTKDFEVIIQELQSLGLKISKDSLILDYEISLELETDIPFRFQQNVSQLQRQITNRLLIHDDPVKLKESLEEILNEYNQLQIKYNDLLGQYEYLKDRFYLNYAQISKWELRLREKYPDLLTLGIPQSIWDLDLVARHDKVTKEYYKEVYGKEIWDVFEQKTWDAFKFLGMKTIHLGHARRFQSFPDSGVINIRMTREYGAMHYLILIDNKCTKYSFDKTRFEEYKGKLSEYVYDATLEASAIYQNCNPDYFVLISPEFDNNLFIEAKSFENEYLLSSATKVVLMKSKGLSQLVLDHAKNPYIIGQKPNFFENRILRYKGVVDDSVIKREYSRLTRAS